MAEPRRNAIYPLIQDRNDIFTVPWYKLKERFKTVSDDEFKAFMDFLLEEEWILELDRPKIEKLMEIILCNVTLNQCSNLLDSFMGRLDKRRCAIGGDLNKGPDEQVILNIYNFNYEVFEFIVIQRWVYSVTRNTPPTCKEEKTLCMLEVLLSKDFYCKSVVEKLFTDVSLEHKAHHSDLLDIILDSGRIEYLGRVTALWMYNNRSEQEKEIGDTFKEYLGRNTRRWIYLNATNPVEYLGAVLQNLKLYECIIPDLLPYVIFNSNNHYDLLSDCKSLDTIKMCVGELPKEITKEALQKRGTKLLLNIVQNTDNLNRSEELDACIELLEKEGVDMTPIFMAREHCDRLTLLDYVCLHRDINYVKVILNRMNDKDKRILLFTKNYGGRDPLDHCRYYNYNGNLAKEELIHSEMVRLTH
jgi:hypothetical protein